MMSSYQLPLAVFVACCVGMLEGRSAGGDLVNSHCKDLHPAHSGISSQTSAAPYTITTDIDPGTGYTPGATYTVSIQATNDTLATHGFIVQFRNYNNLTSRGVFTAWNASTTTTCNCDRIQDTITHFNPGIIDLPNTISFSWQAPAAGSGPLRIWSSWVRSFQLFWVNGFVSNEIQESGMVTPVMPTATPSMIDLMSCGTAKGCHRIPPSCSSQQSCGFIYTQRVVEDYVEVELSTNVAGWIAVGYSVDRIMGGTDNPPDDVLACQRTGGGMVQVKNARIIAISATVRYPRNDNQTVPDEGITTLDASYVNGILSCRFRRLLYTGSAFDKDLRQPYHQLYAYDRVPGGVTADLSYHATFAPSVSNMTVFMNSTRNGLGGADSGDDPSSGAILLAQYLMVAFTAMAVLFV